MAKPRARDLGLEFPGTPGLHNALTDVPGVLVGYTTLIDESAGPVRTGVTAILPFGHDLVPRPVWAGQFSLNGNGEMTGVHWIHDAGYFLGPVCITNTHSVGIVHHAATRWIIDTYGDAFGDEHVWAMPVVAETYDGVLNDINGQHVREAHAIEAIENAAGGRPAEGNVGGGTGMVCYEFKGGTGTASRIVELGGETFTVGALVQANHGVRDWLTVRSVIVVIGTDAPLSALSLRHLAKRASIGIGRHGTPSGNSSGDIFLAFSTANKRSLPKLTESRQSFDFISNEILDPCYLAAVESVEEAVVNALVAAETMTTVRPEGLTCRAIDHDALCDAMRRYGRLRE
jgi:D-aminopeptidase